MKLKTIAAVCIFAPNLASAFTISITNQATIGDPSLPILDNTGAPLTSGSVGVGFFADDASVTDNSLDFGTLLTNFFQFGTTEELVQGAAPGLISLTNPAAFDVVVPIGSTGGQIGESVFVVFGNSSTLANSDQLAVFRSDSIFGTDDAAGQGGVTVVLGSNVGTLLLGDNTGPTIVSNDLGSITFADNIQLVSAVPEPSSSLLAGLAGLALLARRRR